MNNNPSNIVSNILNFANEENRNVIFLFQMNTDNEAKVYIAI